MILNSIIRRFSPEEEIYEVEFNGWEVDVPFKMSETELIEITGIIESGTVTHIAIYPNSMDYKNQFDSTLRTNRNDENFISFLKRTDPAFPFANFFNLDIHDGIEEIPPIFFTIVVGKFGPYPAMLGKSFSPRGVATEFVRWKNDNPNWTDFGKIKFLCVRENKIVPSGWICVRRLV